MGCSQSSSERTHIGFACLGSPGFRVLLFCPFFSLPIPLPPLPSLRTALVIVFLRLILFSGVTVHAFRTFRIQDTKTTWVPLRTLNKGGTDFPTYPTLDAKHVVWMVQLEAFDLPKSDQVATISRILSYWPATWRLTLPYYQDFSPCHGRVFCSRAKGEGGWRNLVTSTVPPAKRYVPVF